MKSKDTEVGRIPVDWEVRQVSEIGEVIAGGTPRTKVDEYWNGEIAWITPKDLSGYNNKYIYKGERSITKIGLENSSARLLPKGTVLFSSRAPIGYVAIAGKDMATNQGFKSIVCDKSIANNIFIYYLMKYKKEEIENIAGGSTFKEVSGKVINQFNVQIPPLTEQKVIADTLSSLDDKIELNNKINENLEQQAQAIFKHWFIDFEFPDENGNPYKSSGGEMLESELGMIPKGWELLRLNDVATLSAGGDKPEITSKYKTNSCPVPIYSNGISKEGLYGYTNKAKIKEESITVSARGTIGFVCLRQEPFVPIVRLITLIPKTEFISAKYLYYAVKQMNIQGTGTTQQQLTVPAFKTSPILVSTIDIIKEYTKIINSMFDQINLNKIENEKLSQLRDTLLQKLMSGEIRIPLD